VPLGLEGGFEPREEAVEGIPEFLELVLRPVQGQAFVQAGRGDPPGRTGDGPDGPKHPAGHEPAGQQGEDGHDGQGDPRVDQKLVRVGRALRGLYRPGLGQLMHRLAELMDGLGQLMLVLRQLLLVPGQLLVLRRKRTRRPSAQPALVLGQLVLGLQQLLLDPFELPRQSRGQRRQRLETLDGGRVRDLGQGRRPVFGGPFKQGVGDRGQRGAGEQEQGAVQSGEPQPGGAAGPPRPR
jgi:hypothetical protein